MREGNETTGAEDKGVGARGRGDAREGECADAGGEYRHLADTKIVGMDATITELPDGLAFDFKIEGEDEVVESVEVGYAALAYMVYEDLMEGGVE